VPYLSLSPLPFLDTLTLIGLLAGLTSFWVAWLLVDEPPTAMPLVDIASDPWVASP